MTNCKIFILFVKFLILFINTECVNCSKIKISQYIKNIFGHYTTAIVLNDGSILGDDIISLISNKFQFLTAEMEPKIKELK
jgi:hypothetical protein